MTCSAGDLLTSREAAHPAAGSLEASRIKHKSAVSTGQREGRWEGRRHPERECPLSPLAAGLRTLSPWLLEENQDWEWDWEFILAPSQTGWAALGKLHPPPGLSSQLSQIRSIVPLSLMALLLRS